MRLLTITADFPPYHAGGYGIRVKNIMDGLFAKGHEVLLLTTRAKGLKTDSASTPTYAIKRVLHGQFRTKPFPHEVLFDIQDINAIDKAIKKFEPDLIYLGHIYPLTKQLLPFLATLNIPIVCDEGGNSLKGAWTEQGRWFRFTGDYQPRFRWLSKLKPVVIQTVKFFSGGRIQEVWVWPGNMAVIFNSRKNQSYVLGLGVPIQRSRVIYSGIDTDVFTFQKREALHIPVSIICPGRIEPRKGQIDAVRLIALLNSQGISANLIIVGEVMSADYKRQILEEIKRSNLEEQIELLPMITQEDLAKLYHQADICFFSSYQESGLSRIPLEAMACGSIVISYGNEGSDEIIQNGVNGYCGEPGNIQKAEEIISALLASPAKVQNICTSALAPINETYALPAYIEEIEEFAKQSF